MALSNHVTIWGPTTAVTVLLLLTGMGELRRVSAIYQRVSVSCLPAVDNRELPINELHAIHIGFPDSK